MKVFDYDAPLMESSVCYRDTNGILYILDREKKVGYSVHSDYLWILMLSGMQFTLFHLSIFLKMN